MVHLLAIISITPPPQFNQSSLETKSYHKVSVVAVNQWWYVYASTYQFSEPWNWKGYAIHFGRVPVRSKRDNSQCSLALALSDVQKLLSGSASCDLCKSSISILQKKAIGELYQVVPVSSCAFNVCFITKLSEELAQTLVCWLMHFLWSICWLLSISGHYKHWTRDPRTRDPRSRGPEDRGLKDPDSWGLCWTVAVQIQLCRLSVPMLRA